MAILFEPFKMKVVEALPLSTEKQRSEWIREVGYNVFSLLSDQVTIDLLTDSGTAAMSDLQWAAMMQGDESYAGSRSFMDLQATVRAITGFEHVIPVHQGRAAEHLLFSTLLKGEELIPSNGLFDTTGANIADQGALGLNLPCAEGLDPYLFAPFKGNVDLARLEETLRAQHARVPFVLMTITNNSHGGQPVSIENLRQVRTLCNRFGKLLVLDACRFAENSYFVKLREQEFFESPVAEIARHIFDLADIVTFSGKKDALVNIGGLLCVRDRALASEIRNIMVVQEGFPTYGGLAGYSLAAMAQGLREVLDEHYLAYRLRTIEWTVERLVRAGVPVLQPAGGHAVYIESSAFYPQIPRHRFPGLVLTTNLYVRGGIRTCELGGVAFGKRDSSGREEFPPLDLVRLAIPRRVYTEAHLGYVVEILLGVFSDAEQETEGFDFEYEAPVLRHFNSTFRRSA